MKLTHELANHFFEKLSIAQKRNIFSIVCELQNAKEKHKSWPTDHIHAAAIVGEEAGELLQATIQHRYEKGQYFSIHKEAIQTGAMVLRLLENMPKKKLVDESPETEPKYQPLKTRKYK